MQMYFEPIYFLVPVYSLSNAKPSPFSFLTFLKPCSNWPVSYEQYPGPSDHCGTEAQLVKNKNMLAAVRIRVICPSAKVSTTYWYFNYSCSAIIAYNCHFNIFSSIYICNNFVSYCRTF